MGREPDDWNDLLGAEIYAETARWGHVYPVLAEHLVDALGAEPPGPVLDLACGTGIVAEALRRRWESVPVVGLDLAPAMAGLARRALPEPLFAALAADPRALPLPGAVFAAATCSAALWHFPQLGAALGELRRCLKAEGRFAFSIPCSQLRDEATPPPAPLQLALARVGRQLFGRDPSPAGPVLARRELIARGRERGFTLGCERHVDLVVPQGELLDLLEVPALGARLYPEADPERRGQWLERVRAAVDPAEAAEIRWWCATFVADPIFPPAPL
ncbi:MAG: methyltransferase domain-containing protein [Acidobacteriota bacterium]|nr:methyltransferase domain-containing protein [Acidobacteriota bacterium]MDQ7088794.1 methyltransferase domain-containing protein [Acidobacteriota bacterium]